MHPSTADFFLLLTATAICSFSLTTTHALLQPPPPAVDNIVRVGCIPREREALLAFKQGITEDPYGLLDSWQRGGDHDQQDCCRWRGVRCSNRTGHVLKLRLRNDNVDSSYVDYATHYGIIQFSALVGQISHSLLALEHLKYLDLSSNSLEGSTGRIPDFLGSLRNLKYLNLSGIDFTGGVPPQLGNLSKLQYLDLSGTLTNSTDVSWLTRLRLLEYLNLRGVNLSAIADWSLVMNMIPSLRVLDLSSCSLESANQSLPRLNFTTLQELHLSSNYFDHPIASGWFWSLKSLKYLDLGSTMMYGRFPDALGDMASLEFLDFSGYAYSSKGVKISHLMNLCNLKIIDLHASLLYGDAANVFESLPRCSPNKLQELYMSENNIHGMLTNRLGQITSLIILDLSRNNITGSLPAWIGNFTSLRTLDLSGNNLTHVPEEIGVLSNLTLLNLANNDLDGIITDKHLASLNMLQIIYLSSNSLKINISSKWQPPFKLQHAVFATCQMGPAFPAWLQWLVDIVYLDISSTGINDRIPHWFTSAFPNATYLDLSNNRLNGALPGNMEIMSVEYLDLRSNELTGQIPPLPQHLTKLDISMNSLSGPLPANIGVQSLEVLSLFSNRITGRIPDSICNCAVLKSLGLANNLFEGEIPLCIGNTTMTNLYLSNNSFSGEIPSSLQNCTLLQVLDLSENMFSGRLPEWIGKLTTLQFLRLNHNMLSGHIPINLTNLECLQYIDIAGNGLSGSLPRDLSNLTALRQKYQAHFCFVDFFNAGVYSSSLDTVLKGQQLNFGSISRILDIKMMSIDLSSNNLTGEIPEEIGTLEGLMNLNLSRNNFGGNVPNMIGAMQSLQSLDLSQNTLSGGIPGSLSNLTFLSHLDLSYNNFSGRIPSGSQLDSLYAENPYMYAGNIGLCGPPLKRNCSGTDASKQGHLRKNEEGSSPEFFYLGLGCGSIAGIWVVFIALLFKRGWRIAYFHLFDKLYDKTYVLVVVTWDRITRKTEEN